MPSWNIKELRELIEKKHGSLQLEKATPHIRSVDWKIAIASCHSYTSKEAFVHLFDDDSQEYVRAVKLLLSTGEEASSFNEAKLISEANIIACAQSMHSIADILAHVIFHTFMISEIEEREISINRINRILPQGKLKSKVTRLLGMTEFCYLDAFVNTTKHKSIVFSGYHVDLKENPEKEHGIKFEEFTYKDNQFNEKWDEEFLNELSSLSYQYVDIGNEINETFKETYP